MQLFIDSRTILTGKFHFDSIDLKEANSDIFDVGVQDDSLALLYNANEEIQMSVKNSIGLIERQAVNDIVLQGDAWGSILASVQVDSICKEVVEAGLGYQYKDSLEITILGLKSAEKCLQFGVSKCKSIFVGEHKEEFLDSWLTMSLVSLRQATN